MLRLRLSLGFQFLLFLLLTSSAPVAAEFIQVESLSGEKLAHLMDDHLSLNFVDKTTFFSFVLLFCHISHLPELSVPIILSISRTCPPHLCWGADPIFRASKTLLNFNRTFDCCLSTDQTFASKEKA